MAPKSLKYLVFAGSILLLPGLAAHADFYDGLRAFDNKDYRNAVAAWRMAANQGDAKSQLRLGRLYEAGLGVPQVYVEAHRWFNLAAAQGADEARNARDAIADKMTRDELAEARKLAASFKPVTAAPDFTSTPYKSLPVGTTIDYGSWKCKVESNQKTGSTCVGSNGDSLHLASHFIAIGKLPTNGYGGRVPRIDCPRGGGGDGSSSFRIGSVNLVSAA